MIHNAENRYTFSRILDTIMVDQPVWKNLTSISEARKFCEDKYPVLVRPSYVLSGAAMNTVYSEKDLANFLNQASEVSKEYPVVITKYIEGAKEIEMDAVAKNGELLCHFISEHVENAGVHSGDATLILPPQDLEPETIRRITEATQKIANQFNITGPMNIQFIAKDNEIKVIECNIRASRSFPFVSKVMGVDLIEMATKAMVGLPVQGYPPINIPADYVGVKVPQFSFSRLSGADPVLGVEMASTGEVACFGRDKYEAYMKGLISTGFRLPKRNILFSIGSYEHKTELLPFIKKVNEMGFNIFATPGTADFLQENGVPVKFLEVLGKDEEQNPEYSLTQHLSNNLIDLYINLPSSNRYRRPANYMSSGYRTRRMAIDYQTPLVTNIKNAKMLIEAMSRHYDLEISNVDYQTSADESSTAVDETTSTRNSGTAALQSIDTRRFSVNRGSISGNFFNSNVPDSLADRDRPTQAGFQEEALGISLRAAIALTISSQHLLVNSSFKNKSIISVSQFTKADLHLLFTVASDMRIAVQRHGVLDILKGKLLCTMFYEPSTRTSASFDAAMQRLGGRTIAIPVAHSSTQKGETLQDTVRTLACYGDAVVLRHPDNESADIAAKYSPVPVINGGNGTREHPTQAFLDLFTIREEHGTLNGLVITFIGDLKYGRTVHSLCKLLEHYNVQVQLVSPTSLALPRDVRQKLVATGQLISEGTELTAQIVAKSDVLYCTRVQKERFPSLEEYDKVKDTIIVNSETMRHAKKTAIVMHPLPRNMEVSEEVDFDVRAAYFRQMRYGLFCRMALLALVLYN